MFGTKDIMCSTSSNRLRRHCMFGTKDIMCSTSSNRLRRHCMFGTKDIMFHFQSFQISLFGHLSLLCEALCVCVHFVKHYGCMCLSVRQVIQQDPFKDCFWPEVSGRVFFLMILRCVGATVCMCACMQGSV